MDDLFRFVALRPPTPSDKTEAIDLTAPETLYKVELGKIHEAAPTGPSPRPIVRRPLLLPSMSASHAPPSRLQQAVTITHSYIGGAYGGGFVADPKQLVLAPSFSALSDASAKTDPLTLTVLKTLVQDAFGSAADAVAADPEFQKEKLRVSDSIIAGFISPPLDDSLSQLVHIVRLIDLVEAVARGEEVLNDPQAIASALNKTIILPTTVFPLRPDLPQPVGVGDLLVVKQHLKRYERGEIANIENILRGEIRKKSTKHTLTMDRTLVSETEKTTETTSELSTTERFELKTESANVLKEDIQAHAGLSVSAKYGSVEINANADVAYGRSKEDSSKASMEHAKDVTSRAATKVTDRVRQQQTIRTIETYEEDEDHSFDNTVAGAGGTTQISGVYQWINKIYEAQVFNYGSRLLFDLMIPEPAAFLLDAVATSQAPIRGPEPFVVVFPDPNHPNVFRPVRPSDLGADGLLKPGILARPIAPADLSHDRTSPYYYGIYAAKYAAAGLKAPPDEFTTVSKAITGTVDDKGSVVHGEDLKLPAGYHAIDIAVQGAFNGNESDDNTDGDEYLQVFVGKYYFWFLANPPPNKKLTLNPASVANQKLERGPLATGPGYTRQIVDERDNLPIAIEARQAKDYAVTVDVVLRRTDAAFEQWLLDTHGAIMQAYQKQLGDFQDKLAAQGFQTRAQASLGGNPDQNRLLERTELKKACISLLTGLDIQYLDAAFNGQDFDGVNPSGNFLPKRPQAAEQGKFIRFFEQAFEWEQITYIFYPYFWGRKTIDGKAHWQLQALASNDEPLFREFLKAGAARVVIPVRPQLEADLRYYLITGQIWRGGHLPEITDADYLPITEEIKERDNAPGDEHPQGDPWEVILPTTLIKLRADDSLPDWRKFVVNKQDVWVPGQTINGKWVPDYGTVDDNGVWSPQ